MINYSVIIPANGIGQRFNNKLPKQFVLIRNRPLIFYTIDAFVNCGKQLKEYKLNEIVIACSGEFNDFIQEKIVQPLLKENKFLKIKLIKGDSSFRHQSIFNCLQYLADLNDEKGRILTFLSC